MARNFAAVLFNVLCFGSLMLSAVGKILVKPVVLTEGNWTDMLTGEWLVEFYAPWCPACKALAPNWQKVAGWGADLGFRVAEVDVTENPGLSGRFLVMALPTIFHVKDGVFRTYSGSRDETEFVSFVDDKKYEAVDPVPWWKSPSSIQMGAVGLFFKASMFIREIHSQMTEEYGLPVWASYAVFAFVTIVFGMLLGLFIVFLCDVILPPRPAEPPSQAKTSTFDSDDFQSGKTLNADGESDLPDDDHSDVIDQGEESDKSNIRQRNVKSSSADSTVKL